MRTLLLVVSLFFLIVFQTQSYFQSNQLTPMKSVQAFDAQADRIYPLQLEKKQARILVVPHATNENAQNLMAATYKVLQGQTFDTIILLSQNQGTLFHGVALPYCTSVDGCTVDVSQVNIFKKLSQHKLFHYYQAPFHNNIGVQLQCAYLNFYCSQRTIISLVVGEITPDDAHAIAAMLISCCSAETLIVMSTDIADYKHVMHDRPVDISKVCKLYDEDADKIQLVQSPALEKNVHVFSHRHASMFAVLFELLQTLHFKDIESYFVGYATSCSDSTPVENITTFAAFIFQDGHNGYKNKIGSYEQIKLLQQGRLGLEHLFGKYRPRDHVMVSYEMSQPHGAFASLYNMSDHGIILKGCIGKVQTVLPLYTMVYEIAQQAASQDRRFYPLRQKDLESTILSLSVITDLQALNHVEMKPSDGVMLRYDDKVAICLPPIVPPKDWNQESVLMDLSNQIGTSSFVWKKPAAKIFTFNSLVFQEE